MPHDYTSADLIGFALEKQPEEFKQTFNAIMGQRVADAVASKKEEVANSYMADEAETDEEEQETTEEEQDGQDSEANA